MIVKTTSAACLGIKAYLLDIEVDVSFGMPQFIMVGLPDATVKESKERVRSAIKNSGYAFPSDKIIINLAPADIKKEGPAFDLPIALGLLAATEIIPIESLRHFLILGELALDGSLRPIKGVVPIAAQFPEYDLILPLENAKEAAAVRGIKIYPASNLTEVIQFFLKELSIAPYSVVESAPPKTRSLHYVNFSEVKGQAFAKRALEIAVSGGHNLMMIGPPGSGKTMLARRIPTILPPLDFEEALEITKIYSCSSAPQSVQGLWTERPFRAPHHTISSIALSGGGSYPRPGEMSLAHGGVLFLDELPEFKREAIECLRSPLEDGYIHIARAKQQISFPAQFMLVAAMNPCPCGFLTDRRKSCRCSLSQIQKYQHKISGPILDRIDLHIEVPALISVGLMSEDTKEETSEQILERVLGARTLQQTRFRQTPIKLNARMGPKELKAFAKIDSASVKLLENAMRQLRLSARAYYKILKISRTIADLAESEPIQEAHIAEAIQYRSLDRQW